MSDLIERLRNGAAPLNDPDLNDDAADEIERLRRELAECKDEIARADYATRRATEQLAEAREWIATHPPRFGGDHACRQCYPHGYSLVDGFVCQYHKALAAKERKP